MSYKTLTPIQKRRLKKSIDIANKLMTKKELSDVGKFVLRERVRIILSLLGADPEKRILRHRCTEVIGDGWTFKILRLRKIINGW